MKISLFIYLFCIQKRGEIGEVFFFLSIYCQTYNVDRILNIGLGSIITGYAVKVQYVCCRMDVVLQNVGQSGVFFFLSLGYHVFLFSPSLVS